MRGAIELVGMAVKIEGKAGKIIGFWLSDLDMVYAKVQYKDKTYCNYPLEKIKDIVIRNEKHIKYETY
jgi:hypothetical protein